MALGLVALCGMLVVVVLLAVVARRQGWLGTHESLDDRLSSAGRVEAARHRANSSYPF